MSFATLSGTLEECSLISKLELTKNPFDSQMEDRLNLPAMSSPSIFSKTETPGSQKKKEFRWSIDQMSKLNPADIDEFPNQEYSSTYERSEDEQKAQEAINEYFSHGTILPSPWTPENHVKHVTFSPLPPSTAYISGEDDSMTDVSRTSSTSSGRQQTMDICCQTSLTFAPSFDLSKILDSGFYSYVEEENSYGRDLNVSSLRRKLFSQDDSGSPTKPVEQSSKEKTRSILKSASPMNLLTSSPLKDRGYLQPADPHSAFSSGSKPSLSPPVSPIKIPHHMAPHNASKESSVRENEGTLSIDEVFTSYVFESSDVSINPLHLPDVSPIKDPTRKGPTAQYDSSVDDDEEQNNDKLRDGGPMKLSELSNLEMDYEDEDSNNNSGMEIAEPQPSTLTPAIINRQMLVSNSDRIGKQHDVISDDVVVEKNGGVINHKRHEVIAGTRDDVLDAVLDDVIDDIDDVNDNVTAASREIRKSSPRSNLSGLCEGPTGLKGTDVNDIGSDGRPRRRGINGDNWESAKENIEGRLRGDYVIMNDAEEALIKRASDAMKRADKLVLETNLEQGTRIPRKTGTSAAILNWSRVDGASLWQPIYMSTPVVGGEFTKEPHVLKTADSSLPRPRALAEVDSYNNLLSSFANSRLDQGPRSYGPASQDSGLGTIFSSESGARNRARTLGLETRTRRSLNELRNSSSQELPRDVYLFGRYSHSGITSKRFSWPPWKTLRSRYPYLSSRPISPRIPCGLPRQRRRASEERPKARRSDDLKKFPKPMGREREKYADYFDGMHSTLRKTHNYR